MQSLSRILLPVDFSPRSASAAHYAATLACHFGSELVLMHALVPPQFEFGAVDMAGSMLAELCRDRLFQAKRDLAEFLDTELAGARVRRVVVEGDPSECIVEFAHNEGCGLIVMPTHGYGPFRRFILGSNTAKVLHDADCPVWTGVHLEEAPAAPPIPIRHIVCAVDLGAQSANALCWAAGVAREFGARLTLLHATPCGADVGAAAGGELRQLQESANVEAERTLVAGGARAGNLRGGQTNGSRCPGDRPRVGSGSLRTFADPCVRHHPAVAMPGGQRIVRRDCHSASFA